MKKNNNNMNFGALTGLLDRMQDMQEKITDMDKKLEAMEFKGVAGCGEDEDVKCELSGNGKFKVSGLAIGRRFVNLLGSDGAEELEGLLMTVIQDYFNQVQNSSGENITNVASGVGLPTDWLNSGQGKPNLNLSDLNGVLRQMQDMQKKLTDAEKKLASVEFKATASCGDAEETKCEIIGNGKYYLKHLVMGSRYVSLLTEDEADLLSDLLVATIHDYCKKVRGSSGSNIADVASEMGLPMDLLESNLGGLLGTEDEFK